MKRIAWTALMVSVTAALLVSAPREATADDACWDLTCTRTTTCESICPTCNGTVFVPGTCWYVDP